MSITIGQTQILDLRLVDNEGELTDDPSLALHSLAPDGTRADITQSDGGVVHDGLGLYHAELTPDQVGTWRWRWDSTQTVRSAAEGTFEVVSTFAGSVSDICDVRVLIPACRRAIDGPTAMTPDAPSTTLNDQEVVALLADATAELILHTASMDGTDVNGFGNSLLVVERDPYYLAPVAWRTDRPRTNAQDAAILSQAALNYYFFTVRQLKVSESLKNEAVDWTYTLSAQVIAGWMTYLIANRDKAIDALRSINVVLDTYISLVAERDRLSAAWLEPYVAEVGAPVPYVGGGGSGPLEYDYRFNTWG